MRHLRSRPDSEPREDAGTLGQLQRTDRRLLLSSSFPFPRDTSMQPLPHTEEPLSALTPGLERLRPFSEGAGGAHSRRCPREKAASLWHLSTAPCAHLGAYMPLGAHLRPRWVPPRCCTAGPCTIRVHDALRVETFPVSPCLLLGTSKGIPADINYKFKL